MRKLILTAAGCMCLAGATYFLNTVVGQEKAARKEAAADEIPHKIALIDMEYVFKNYEKLKYLEEDLKADLAAEKENFDKKVKKGREMEAMLKDLKPDSPEFEAGQQKVAKMAGDLQIDQKLLQNKMQRENAKMTLTVYHEVHDAVERFCKHYNYTLVIQFTRSDANSSDPNRMRQIVSQPVVYYRKSENGKCRDDLSEPVVKWLNDKYAKDSGADPKTADDKSTTSRKDSKVKPAEATVPSGTKRGKTVE